MTYILLVEDQPALRQLVSEILGFSGYQVMTLPNGREALALLRSGTYFPNLILSDLLMDGGNGDEFLKAVRSEGLWREISFILMSGKDQIEAFPMEFNHDIQGYLEKPFGIAEILLVVQKALSARRQDSDQDSSSVQRPA